MSKGYHRLAADQPWDNRAAFGIAPAPANNLRTPSEPAQDDAMRPIEPLPSSAAVLSEAMRAASFDPGPPKMTTAQAKSAGFTGNSCNECGSMQMVRNGTCEKCNSCGSTTGCS